VTARKINEVPGGCSQVFTATMTEYQPDEACRQLVSISAGQRQDDIFSLLLISPDY